MTGIITLQISLFEKPFSPFEKLIASTLHFVKRTARKIK
jgi:hypothetical protein